ncbi:MAG: hypothetical protein R6X06_07250 [Gammaproteobacteria bacterium]
MQVYFHYSTGYYYYPYGGQWRRTRVLPAHVHLNPRERVHLHIEHDRPYIDHHRHVQKYRPHPQQRLAPQSGRQEREHHRDRYQQQQDDHSQRRLAPAPREFDRGDRSERRREQDQQREPARRPHQDKDPGPIRFDAAPQHKPRPLVSGQATPPPQERRGRDAERGSDGARGRDKDRHDKADRYQRQRRE